MRLVAVFYVFIFFYSLYEILQEQVSMSQDLKSEQHAYSRRSKGHQSGSDLNYKYIFGNSTAWWIGTLARRIMIQLRTPLYPVKLLLELSKESWTRWQLDRHFFLSSSHLHPSFLLLSLYYSLWALTIELRRTQHPVQYAQNAKVLMQLVSLNPDVL